MKCVVGFIKCDNCAAETHCGFETTDVGTLCGECFDYYREHGKPPDEVHRNTQSEPLGGE